MKMIDNKPVFKTNRADLFTAIVDVVKVFAVLVTIFVCLSIWHDKITSAKLDDPKAENAYAIADSIKDNYLNVFFCDGKVSVDMDEVIDVSVTTTNYVVSAEYDLDGNLIVSEVEGITNGSETTAGILLTVIISVVVYLAITIPSSIIARKLKAKDDYDKKVKNSLESALYEVSRTKFNSQILTDEYKLRKVKEAEDELEKIKEQYGLKDADLSDLVDRKGTLMSR